MVTKTNPLLDLNLQFDTTGTAPVVSPEQTAQVASQVVQGVTREADEIANITQGAKQESDALNQLFSQVDMQAINRRDAKIEAAQINTDTVKEANNLSQSTVNQYEAAVNGAQANKQRTMLLNRVNQFETELNEARQLIENGNFWQRNFTGVVAESRAKSNLLEARQELEMFQRQNLNNARAAHNAQALAFNKAQQGNAIPLAKQQELIQTSAAYIEELQLRGNVSKERLADYGRRLNFSKETMDSLNTTMRTLVSANNVTRESIATAMQIAQKKEYDRMVSERNLTNENVMNDINSYLESIGNTTLIGKTSNPEDFERIYPDAMSSYRVWAVYRSTNGGANFTAAQLAAQQGTLDEQDRTILRMGNSVVEQQNAIIMNQISDEIKEKNLSPTQQKQLIKSKKDAGQLIDINDPKHFSRIDELINEQMERAERGANFLLQTELLILPDTDAVLGDPTFLENLEAPSAAIARFMDKEWQNIDWSITRQDPAGSYQGIVDSVAGLMSQKVLTNQLPQADMEAQINQLSQGAAAYYKQLRRTWANSTGLTNLSSIRIQGISLDEQRRDPNTGQIITGTVDLENPSVWRTSFMTKIRKSMIESRANRDLFNQLRGGMGGQPFIPTQQ